MTKGGLLRWHVKEGTAVESGDTIAEIETDKATLDFDTMDEGIIAKILVAAGTKDIEVTRSISRVRFWQKGRVLGRHTYCRSGRRGERCPGLPVL